LEGFSIPAPIQRSFTLARRNTVLPKLHDIPSEKIPYFIGRKDILEMLQETFRSSSRDNSKRVVVVLLGMGGQGKTQIALEYCGLARDNYDYILWADAYDQSSLERSFDRFASNLGGFSTGKRSRTLTTNSSDFNDPASSLRVIENSLRDRRSLLVLDNLDDPSAATDVYKFMDVFDRGDVIITRYGQSCENT
jgi:NB-ARC domain